MQRLGPNGLTFLVIKVLLQPIKTNNHEEATFYNYINMFEILSGGRAAGREVQKVMSHQVKDTYMLQMCKTLQTD